MKPAATKAEETMKRKLLEIIRKHPGIHGIDPLIPRPYRRLLRALEKEQGLIAFVDGGWRCIAG